MNHACRVGGFLHVGGKAPHTHIVHGSASRFWGGDILPLAWARRIRAKRSAALARGRGPKPPLAFARLPALLLRPLATGVPKDATPSQVMPSRPFSESLGSLCTKDASSSQVTPFRLFSESFGVLYTKDATPSRMERLPSGGGVIKDAPSLRGAGGGDCLAKRTLFIAKTAFPPSQAAKKS